MLETCTNGDRQTELSGHGWSFDGAGVYVGVKEWVKCFHRS